MKVNQQNFSMEDLQTLNLIKLVRIKRMNDTHLKEQHNLESEMLDSNIKSDLFFPYNDNNNYNQKFNNFNNNKILMEKSGIKIIVIMQKTIIIHLVIIKIVKIILILLTKRKILLPIKMSKKFSKSNNAQLEEIQKPQVNGVSNYKIC